MRACQVSLHTHKHITKQLLPKLLTAGFRKKKPKVCFSNKNALHSDNGINPQCETELSIMDPVLKKGTDFGNGARDEKNLTAKC